jgi:hypothetical protein
MLPPINEYSIALTITDRPFSLRLLQTRRIGFQVDKFQRVGRNQVGVEYFVLVIVQKQRQTGPCIDAKMLIAFGANVQIIFQIFFPDDLPAMLTLYPQALGPDFLFARGIQFAGLSLEPRHKNFVIG